MIWKTPGPSQYVKPRGEHLVGSSVGSPEELDQEASEPTRTSDRFGSKVHRLAGTDEGCAVQDCGAPPGPAGEKCQEVSLTPPLLHPGVQVPIQRRLAPSQIVTIEQRPVQWISLSQSSFVRCFAQDFPRNWATRPCFLPGSMGWNKLARYSGRGTERKEAWQVDPLFGSEWIKG